MTSVDVILCRLFQPVDFSGVMSHIPLVLEDLQLTPEEQQRILEVVERDEALRQEENLRIRSVFQGVKLTVQGQ